MNPRLEQALAFVRTPRGMVVLSVVVFALGYLVRGGDPAGGGTPASSHDGPAVKWWTCSMHPQIRLQDPDARCPICGMELIPVTEEAGDKARSARLSMSETAKRLAEIQTAPVERRIVVKEIRMVGKVAYDETRQKTISAWVPGRLDRLYVNYTGVAVRTGDPLASVYSPELLVAQQALLEADVAYARMKSAGAPKGDLERQRLTVEALEQRLLLWGVTDQQVAEIRRRGTASDHMKILSPIAGIVVRKRAVEGDYVKVGTKIYEIADLSRVWVYLDAYEMDMAWVRYGQQAQFETEAHPGETFSGQVSFVDPLLNERTRTVRLRVTAENADGRLKPGMFARARIQARLADGGRIVEPSLAGKWISPVHPEVVRDRPGTCPICGTPLISTESLGYVDRDYPAPLVVPATAPLRTGVRAIVYVEVPGTDRPTYEGREVELGPRTRDHYLVVTGLKEGERVVVRGNFKIDSALQLLARPSMMSPREETEPAGRKGGPARKAPRKVPPAFREQVTAFLTAYLALTEALSGDDLEAALGAVPNLDRALAAVRHDLLDEAAMAEWHREAESLRKAIDALKEAKDLEAARRPYSILSEGMIRVLERFPHAGSGDVVRAHCPMAFGNRGADWIQRGETIRNPYFGAAMLRCGAVTARFPARVKR